jgi:carotenoid cleavage dioxygenase
MNQPLPSDSLDFKPTYLNGVHTPVDSEWEGHLTEITGQIPPSLSGIFARNSANPRFEPIGRYHWFDGDGMIHAFTFKEGTVHYRRKYTQTLGLNAEEQANKALWSGILERPQPNLPTPLKDTANTDLTWHNNRFIASWWLSGIPQTVDADLNSLGSVPFTQDLLKYTSISAHPKVDPFSQDLMFFGYNLFKPPYYTYGVVNAQGELDHQITVDLPRAHIPHDIAITSNYTLLIDLPLGWDKQALKQGKRKIGFDSSVPARFGVIPRRGQETEIQWFEAKSCYMYHTIRAFEEGDEIVLTGCRIDNPIRTEDNSEQETHPHGPIIARLDSIHLIPYLYEWRFNLNTGEVQERLLDRTPTEFPRVNDRTLTQKTRYSYNPEIAPQSTLSFQGFIKYDLDEQNQEHVRYPQGWRGGEVCFAPDPLRLDQEDGGWVISVLSHRNGSRSKLVIYDAQKLEEGPISTIVLPDSIPLGFHAEFAFLDSVVSS